MKQGPFFVIEGIDGSGKTSQVQSLISWFASRNQAAISVVDPGGTLAGQKIREILLDRSSQLGDKTEALLFSAARAQLVTELIRPAMLRGDIVIADRFSLSTLAYQNRLFKHDRDDILSLIRFSNAGLRPRLTILLDLDARIAVDRLAGRLGLDRLESKVGDRMENLRQAYLAEAKLDPSIRIVQAGRNAATVQDEIRSIISQAIWGA